MATTKSTRLTSREAGVQKDARLVKGRLKSSQDNEAIATAELDLNDIILYDIVVPSNGIHEGCWMYNDDLDSNACPLLAMDIGLYAVQAFTSTTSSTDTSHAVDGVLDADVLVDGATDAQAATTDWTRLTPDAATFGPEDAGKAYWALLGYDNDPKQLFRVGITVAAAAATAQAGDLALRVDYYED